MNCRVCSAALPHGALFCGECGSSVNAERASRPAESGRGPSDTVIIDPLAARDLAEPPPPSAGRHVREDLSGVEGRETFSLYFSSGEIFVVSGSGLMGRRPVPGDGERFDHLVTVLDPERSVSKTHLEFGQEADELWICDLYSANGTIIHAPGTGPRRCEPGTRFRVARGMRVQMAAQSFLVV